VIQVVRYDEDFVFPWSLVYDYKLPDTDAAKAPVCLGVIADGQGGARPCAHTHADGVYCANGFWGIRHQIEELIGKGSPNGIRNASRRNSHSIRVVASMDLQDATRLAADLQASIGQVQLANGPADDSELINLLWGPPEERPAILILMGHLDDAGPPVGKRIVLVPGSKWLSVKAITDAYEAHLQWSEPGTLILLMACESAATGIETINDFVTSLASVGAAAVVGTECIVFSDFVYQFAKRLTTGLWQNSNMSLGQAMLKQRRQLFQSGNPLAFVFECIGDSDLRVV
jgi:hypothetical protein